VRKPALAAGRGRPRIIPLVPTVIKLLLWMQSHAEAQGKVFDQDHVFVNGRGRALNRGWLSLKMQRLRRRLGLPKGVTYYGLRHRYGLMGIRNGVNLKLLSLCMGHIRTQMTEYGGKLVGELKLQRRRHRHDYWAACDLQNLVRATGSHPRPSWRMLAGARLARPANRHCSSDGPTSGTSQVKSDGHLVDPRRQ
jgi:hypothetical protein